MKSSVASGLDTSLVLSLHPFSFAAQAPAGHGTRGGKRQADMLLPWTWPLPDMSRSVHSSFTVASHPTCSQQKLLYPYVRATHGLLPTLYSGQLLGPCCCCCCYGPASHVCVPPTCSSRQASLHVRMSACVE